MPAVIFNLPDSAPLTPEELRQRAGARFEPSYATPPPRALNDAGEPQPAIPLSAPTSWSSTPDRRFGDRGKAFAAGMVDIASDIAALAELAGLAEPGTLTRNIDSVSDAITRTMSLSAQEDLRRQWTDLGPGGVLSNPGAALTQLARTAPSLLASFTGAGVGGAVVKAGAQGVKKRALQRAVQAGREQGLPAAARNAAARQAARRVDNTAIGIGGAVGAAGFESAVIGGSTVNEIRQEVDALSLDDLMARSDTFPALMQQFGGDEAAARNELIRQSAADPAKGAAVIGAVTAAIPGVYQARLLGRAGRRTRPVSRRRHVATNTAIESAQEVPQELTQAILVGESVQENIDRYRDPNEGLVERGVAAAALGGMTGGGVGLATMGRRNAGLQPPVSPAVPETAPTSETDQAAVAGTPEGVIPPVSEGVPTANPGLMRPKTIPDIDAARWGPETPPVPGSAQPAQESQPAQDTQFIGEPLSDARAQVAHILKPNTKKHTAYFSRGVGEPHFRAQMDTIREYLALPAVRKAINKGDVPFEVYRDPSGAAILTTNPEAVEQYLAAGATEEARAELLGYQKAKSQLADINTAVVVLKRLATGEVLESQMVDADPASIRAVREQYQEDLLPGEIIETTPAGQEVIRRAWLEAAEAFQRERGTEASGSDPQDLDPSQYPIVYVRGTDGSVFKSKQVLPDAHSINTAVADYTADLQPGQRVDISPAAGRILKYSGRQRSRQSAESLQRQIESNPNQNPGESDFDYQMRLLDRALSDLSDGEGVKALQNELNEVKRAIRENPNLAPATKKARPKSGTENLVHIPKGNLAIPQSKPKPKRKKIPFSERRFPPKRIKGESKSDFRKRRLDESVARMRSRFSELKALKKSELQRQIDKMHAAKKKVAERKEAEKKAKKEAKKAKKEAWQTYLRDVLGGEVKQSSEAQAMSRLRTLQKALQSVLANEFGVDPERAQRITFNFNDLRFVPKKRGLFDPFLSWLETGSNDTDLMLGFFLDRNAINRIARILIKEELGQSGLDTYKNIEEITLNPERMEILLTPELQEKITRLYGSGDLKMVFRERMAEAENEIADVDTIATRLLERNAEQRMDAINRLREGYKKAPKVDLQDNKKYRKIFNDVMNSLSIPMAQRYAYFGGFMDELADLRRQRRNLIDITVPPVLTPEAAKVEAEKIQGQLLKLFDLPEPRPLTKKDVRTSIKNAGAAGLEELITETTSGPSAEQLAGLDGSFTGEIINLIPDPIYIDDEPTKRKTKNEDTTPPSAKPTEGQREVVGQIKQELDARSALGVGDTGSGDSPSSNGSSSELEILSRPKEQAPESIPDHVAQVELTALDATQRQGVNSLFYAIKQSFDEGGSLFLADGTGVGKTAQALGLIRAFTHEFQARHSRAPKILIVATNNELHDNFVRDALNLFPNGVFEYQKRGDRYNGLKGITFETYAGIKKVANQSFDLAIFDEGQNIRGGQDSRGEAIDELGITHRLYLSATPAEKIGQLRHIAEALGFSLEEFVTKLDPKAKLTEGRAGQTVDISEVDNVVDFYQNLATYIQQLVDEHRFVRRRYPRQGVVHDVDVTDAGAAMVQMTDGTKITPQAAEQLLQNSYNSAFRAGKRPNLPNYWAASVHLSELAKVEETYKAVVKALDNNEKAILFFARTKRQSKAKIELPLVDGSGQPTLSIQSIPVAAEIITQRLVERYGQEAVADVANHNMRWVSSRIKSFQDDNGEVKVIISGYGKLSEGVNLHATGTVGRRAIYVSPDWSADALDQAMGRVERRNMTKIPQHIMLRSNFTGDIIRQSRVQAKRAVQEIMSLKDLTPFSAENNLLVTGTGAEDTVLVRPYGLPPQSSLESAVREALKAISTNWMGSKFIMNPVLAGYMIPSRRVNEMQSLISPLFDTADKSASQAGIESAPQPASAPDPAPAPPVAPKSLKKRTQKRGTQIEVVQAIEDIFEAADESIDRKHIQSVVKKEKLSLSDIYDPKRVTEAAESLESSSATEFELAAILTLKEIVDNLVGGISNEMEMRAQSSTPLFGAARASEAIRQGLQEGTPLPRLLSQISRSKALSGAERRLVRRIAKRIAGTSIRVGALGEGVRGQYDARTDTITVSEAWLGQPQLAETLIHEAMHAVQSYALRNHFGFRQRVQTLYDQALAAAQAQNNTEILALFGDQLRQGGQANLDEFLTYGQTYEPMTTFLRGVRTGQQSRSFLQRLWDAFLSLIGLKPDNNLYAVLNDLAGRNMTTQRMADETLEPDENTVFNMAPTVQALTSTVGRASAKAATAVFDITGFKDVPETGTQLRDRIRRLGVGMGTLNHLNTIYGKVLDRLPSGNPLRRWMDANHRREVTVKQMVRANSEVHRAYNDAVREDDGKHKATIERLIGEATLWGIHADKPFGHSDNDHLRSSKDPAVVDAYRDVHKDLRTLYQSSPVVSRIYDTLFAYYAKELRDNFDLRVRNIFDAFSQAGSEVIHIQTEKDGSETRTTFNTPAAIARMAEQIRSPKNPWDLDGFYVRTVDDDGFESLDDTASMQIQQVLRHDASALNRKGPYAPLKRFGNWAVAARQDVETIDASLSDDEIDGIEAKTLKKVATKLNVQASSRADLDAKGQRIYDRALRIEKQSALRSKLRKNATYVQRQQTTRGFQAEPIIFDDQDPRASLTFFTRHYSQHDREADALRMADKLVENGWELTHRVTRKPLTIKNLNMVNSVMVETIRSKLKSRHGEGAMINPMLTALEASALEYLPETALARERLRREGILGFDTNHGRSLAAHLEQSAWYRGTLEHGRELSDASEALRTAEKEIINSDAATFATDALANQAQTVIQEVRKRVNNEASADRQLSTPIRLMSNFGFLWVLVSPMYVMMNSSQPWLFTLPWLSARAGDNQLTAARALGSAYTIVSGEILKKRGIEAMKQAVTDRGRIAPQLFDFLDPVAVGSSDVKLSKGLVDSIQREAKKTEGSAIWGSTQAQRVAHADNIIDMLTELSKRNRLDFSLAQDMSTVAEGAQQDRVWDRVMDIARIFPHLTEVLNRSTTAIAAYQMGVVNHGMTHEQATQFADEAVTETQFDYTLLNKPRLMSELTYPLLKPIMMFMQHPQHVWGLFVQHTLLGAPAYKEWKKIKDHYDPNNPDHRKIREEWRKHYETVMYVLGMHLLVAGATGVMFEPVKWALGLAAWMVALINGEPPEEVDAIIRRGANRIAGDGLMGRVLSDGLPSALGFHLSDHLGIDHLFTMGNSTNLTGSAAFNQDFVSLFGPLPSVLSNVAWRGPAQIAEGDLLGGLATMSPRILRDVLRAAKTAGQGVTDSNGNVLRPRSDISPVELALQSLGIRTVPTAKLYDQRRAITGPLQWYRLRRSRLSERLYRARGNPSATRRVLADIRAFNALVPPDYRVSERIADSRTAVQKRLTQFGVNLSPSEEWIGKEYGL